MTVSRFRHAVSGRWSPSGTLLGSLAGVRNRVLASWRQHRAERALAGLSYDTLKDIGFPAIDRTTSANQPR